VSKLTAKELKEVLTGEDDPERINFYDFAQTVIDKLMEDGKKGTADWHRHTIMRMKDYYPTLYTTEIDLSFLKELQRFWERDGVKEGINNYMRSLSSLFNKAKDHYNKEDRGIIKIPQSPFRYYEMPKTDPKRSAKNRLVVEEFRKLVNYNPVREMDGYARDIALLMFYLIGINGKDLFYLGKPADGRVSYDRFKTGKPYSIKLEPEALEIIKRYPGKDKLIDVSERYSDHLNFLHYTNIQLHGAEKRKVKGINELLGINKKITTNWMRHTWATFARNNCKISKDDVALCLGHDDDENDTTDFYIDYDYSIIDRSNRKVINYTLGISSTKKKSKADNGRNRSQDRKSLQ